MLKFQRFLSITLFIVFTVVVGSARAGREGPGGTGGGDLANSDLLDFSENAGLVEISPENIRGYHESAEPALKRLEFFIPGFAKDLQDAIKSKPWFIDPRGVIKPQDDHNTFSGVSFEGRMAYQNAREIRVNGKLLKSNQIPNAIWGKLIVHEGVRALSLRHALSQGQPLTEDKIHEIVRKIYAPRVDDKGLSEDVSGFRNYLTSPPYITRSQLYETAEKAQEVEAVFCSGGESAWRALPFNDKSIEAAIPYSQLWSAFYHLGHILSLTESDYFRSGVHHSDDFEFIMFMEGGPRSNYPPELPPSTMDGFIKDAHEFCTRNRTRIERLLRLRDDEPTIASLDQVIQKILAQKIKEPEKKQKSVLRSKKPR